MTHLYRVCGLDCTLIYALLASADDSDVILDMAHLNMSQNSKRVLPKPHKDHVQTARDTYSDVGGLDSFMFMRSCPVVQDRPTTSFIEPINGTAAL